MALQDVNLPYPPYPPGCQREGSEKDVIFQESWVGSAEVYTLMLPAWSPSLSIPAAGSSSHRNAAQQENWHV